MRKEVTERYEGERGTTTEIHSNTIRTSGGSSNGR
jgi:hypothetical protein